MPDGPKVLVLGVGNVLMRDEAIGVRAVEELGKRYRFPENVELLDGGTSGIELLRHICDQDLLIILDAIRAGHPPGTVLRVEGEDVPAQFRTRISPHQLGISDLLAAAMISDQMPKSLLLFGIEPKDVVMGLGLSDEVKTGMERLINVVLDELRKAGCEATPVDDPEALAKRSIWEEVES